MKIINVKYSMNDSRTKLNNIIFLHDKKKKN